MAIPPCSLEHFGADYHPEFVLENGDTSAIGGTKVNLLGTTKPDAMLLLPEHVVLVQVFLANDRRVPRISCGMRAHGLFSAVPVYMYVVAP